MFYFSEINLGVVFCCIYATIKSMNSTPKTIKVYQAPNGKIPFEEWLIAVKDKKTRASIDLRVARLSLGLFGDTKHLSDGVYELRIHIGPGYRVYYGIEGNDIVILLCGGSKASQSKDIAKAQAYLADYRSENDA